MIEEHFTAIQDRITDLRMDRETAIVRGNDHMARLYQKQMLQLYERLLGLANNAWLDSGAAVQIDPIALKAYDEAAFAAWGEAAYLNLPTSDGD